MSEHYRLVNLDAREYLDPTAHATPEALYALAGSPSGFLERLILLLSTPPERGGWATHRIALIGEYQYAPEWLEHLGLTSTVTAFMRAMNNVTDADPAPMSLYAQLPTLARDALTTAPDFPPHDPTRPDLTSLDTLPHDLDTNAILDPRDLPGHASSTPHPRDTTERVHTRWRLTTSTALALMIANGEQHQGPWAGHRITLTRRADLPPQARNDTPTALALLQRDAFFARALQDLPTRAPAANAIPSARAPARVTRRAPPAPPTPPSAIATPPSANATLLGANTTLLGANTTQGTLFPTPRSIST